MIKSARGEKHRWKHRRISSGSLSIPQKCFLSGFNLQAHLPDLLRVAPRVRLIVGRKRITPKRVIAGSDSKNCVDTAERVNDRHKLIAIVTEECPIKVSIKLLLIHGLRLPRCCSAEHDSVPCHFK